MTEYSDMSKHIQQAWDAPVTTAAYKVLMSTSQSPVDLARFKAVVTPHAGDRLHAPPLTAVSLRLSDEAIRVAIGYRLGTNICQSHTRVCGATVDARGLHELACRNSGRRHSQLNYLIWRAVKKAQIPSSKEPIGLSRADSKRPDGATLVPWTRGKRSLGMWQSPIRTRRHTYDWLQRQPAQQPKRQPLTKQRSMSLLPPRISSSRSPSKQAVPGGIHRRPWKTDHNEYQRASRDNISVPEDVGNTTERQCSRLPQHFPRALILYLGRTILIGKSYCN